MRKVVQLADFDQGEYLLKGVEYNTHHKTKEFSDANDITFILNDKAYCAMEDHNDGYRSMFDQIIQVDKDCVKNRFRGQRVRAEHSYEHGYELLRFYDVHTGKIVIEVGTDGMDDYYPCFVGGFYPENMYCNRNVKPE